MPECPTPINLTAEAITESSARLVWEASKENEAFSLRFKPASEPTWDSIEEILGQEYVLSNLEGNTAYVWAVRSFCSENRQSEWSADEQFKTEKLSNKSTKRSFLQVSAFQKQIHILNPSALHIDRINIYALNGTLLAHHEIDSHENVTLTANFDTRIIILSVENGETALRYKVFLP